jgi:hypothetical protein
MTENVVLPPEPGMHHMSEYRAYTVGLDGHFTGFEGMICEDDAKAIESTKRLVDSHDVELWNGASLVIRFQHTSDEFRALGPPAG